jgi:hypothetical protein
MLGIWGGRKCNDPIGGITPKDYVEVMEVAAGRPYDHHIPDRAGAILHRDFSCSADFCHSCSTTQTIEPPGLLDSKENCTVLGPRHMVPTLQNPCSKPAVHHLCRRSLP